MKQFFLPIFRDEDEEMRKFIETEMDKRTRGRAKDEESDEVCLICNNEYSLKFNSKNLCFQNEFNFSAQIC